jgi:16S rRNA (guanine(527)-N(7))-methyltransferase RsmG
MRNEFQKAIAENQIRFDLDLETETIGRLADYYEEVMEHNPLLHLVAPCSAEEFATRHVLESLTLLKHLPRDAVFADIGSGGGLPAIPCLIVREDLKARLIESKDKKTEFLRNAIERLGLGGHAEVIGKQFSETDPGDAEFVTCRALDKFAEHLRRLIKWSGERSLLLFGGEQIGQLLAKYGINAVPELMPLSERRYLFVAVR